jgi:hypothetical protein
VQLFRWVSGLLDRIVGELPGPPPGPPPPDADGRRQGEIDLSRASLEAQLQAKGSAAAGGTMVSSPLLLEPSHR